jgi:hypothetical protein
LIKPSACKQIGLIGRNGRLLLGSFAHGTSKRGAGEKAFHRETFRTTGVHRETAFGEEEVNGDNDQQNANDDAEKKFAHEKMWCRIGGFESEKGAA